MGTQLTKASIFMTLGLAAGVLIGGSGVAAAVALGGRPAQPASGAALVPGATPAGSPETSRPPRSPSPTPRPTPPSNDIPALSRSALRQSVVLNARLAASVAALEDLLAARRFEAFEASQLLRAMSADAVVGLALTPHLASWSSGKEIGADLTEFYLSVQTTAAEGLAASIRNEGAYRTAATNMVRLLGDVDELDIELRAAALAAGIELPAASPAP